MIRWYDWAFAFVAADFLLASLLTALFGETFWHQLFGAMAFTVSIDLWNNVYCRVRYAMEKRNE